MPSQEQRLAYAVAQARLPRPRSLGRLFAVWAGLSVNPFFGMPSQMPGLFGQLTFSCFSNVAAAWAGQQFQPVMPIHVLAGAQMGIPMQSDIDWANRVPRHQPAALAAPGGAAQPPKDTCAREKVQLPPAPSFRDDTAALSSAYKALRLAWKHSEGRVTAATLKSSLLLSADSDQLPQLRLSRHRSERRRQSSQGRDSRSAVRLRRKRIRQQSRRRRQHRQ